MGMYISSEDIAKVLLAMLVLPALASIVLCCTGAVLGAHGRQQRISKSRVVGFAIGWAASVAAFVLCIAVNTWLIGAIASPAIGSLAAYAASRFLARQEGA
jgi:hypothetical protein